MLSGSCTHDTSAPSKEYAILTGFQLMGNDDLRNEAHARGRGGRGAGGS